MRRSASSLFSEVPGDTAAASGEYAGRIALKDVFKDDFHVGVALSLHQILGNDPEAMLLVEKHFDSITPENILKWEEVHPEPNRYRFDAVDRYVALGEMLKKHIVGHTLVWFQQTPAWVFQDESGKPVGRDALLDRMREHIFSVVGRYKGRIHAWDVVNEAIATDGQLRTSKWLEIIGEEYISAAFEFARQADPDALLIYNDYDLETRSKREGVIRLLHSLREKGIQVDGVGTQGHWFLEYPSIEEIEASIVDLSRSGSKVMVTELDVSVLPYYPLDSQVVDLSSFDPDQQRKHNPYPNGVPDSVEKDLANRYAQLFSLFRKHRDKLGRVTLWAVHDGQSWRSYVPIRGRTDYPMLFDRQCRPKPALDAIVNIARL